MRWKNSVGRSQLATVVKTGAGHSSLQISTEFNAGHGDARLSLVAPNYRPYTPDFQAAFGGVFAANSSIFISGGDHTLPDYGKCREPIP